VRWFTEQLFSEFQTICRTGPGARDSDIGGRLTPERGYLPCTIGKDAIDSLEELNAIVSMHVGEIAKCTDSVLGSWVVAGSPGPNPPKARDQSSGRKATARVAVLMRRSWRRNASSGAASAPSK
jgi:hypothetical protein